MGLIFMISPSISSTRSSSVRMPASAIRWYSSTVKIHLWSWTVIVPSRLNSYSCQIITWNWRHCSGTTSMISSSTGEESARSFREVYVSRRQLSSVFALTLTLWLAARAITFGSGQPGSAQGGAFDVIIKNGHIIDGTGSPWYAADVAISNGRIAAIGKLDSAQRRRTIDAAGMVVSPGFIDMLGQSEMTILINPHLPSKIFQGITTEITGEGGSVAPLDDAIIKADQVTYEHLGITPDWYTLGGYFGRLDKRGIGINLASYVGATQVRRMVLGDVDRAPGPAELDQMKSLVRQAMKDGAIGVSTALQYPPA